MIARKRAAPDSPWPERLDASCIISRLALAISRMSLTVEQKTNNHGVPKAGELIEITGAHALEASDRAILNLLYQFAHDSGRMRDLGPVSA